MSETDNRTCVVIGGGIAGLAAAIAMRNAGFEVQVFERAHTIEPLGAAISLWDNALAALDILGASATIRCEAAPVTEMRVLRQTGEAVLGPISLTGGDAFLPRRSLVQSSLMAVLGAEHVTLAAPVYDVVDHGDGVEVRFNGSQRASADIVIVADGIWSTAAQSVLGQAPRYAGYGGVIAMSEQCDAGPPGCAWEYWSDLKRFGLFDVGEGRRYWFYMQSMAAAGEQDARVAHATIAAEARLWPREVRAAVERTTPASLIPFTIHAKPPPKRLGSGRIICVGDAAHAMEPNLGQGACQAIEDAAALQIAATAKPVEGLLQRFEAMRLRRVRSFVRGSASAGRVAHAPLRLERVLSRWMIAAAPLTLTQRIVRGRHRLRL